VRPDAPQRAALQRSNVCGVVVTYFPKAGCAANLAAIRSQVDHLFVIDNGSSGQSLQPIETAVAKLGATIVPMGGNLGIAAALNRGLQLARQHGYGWLATFDQDSQPLPHMIEAMCRALQCCPQSEHVAVIAPRYIDARLGVTVKQDAGEAAGAGWRIIPSTMTSGNLVDVHAATALGGFDESLFMDYVDHDFSLRLNRQGLRVLEASGAQLLHSLGQITEHRLLWKRVKVTNHSAVRRYYMSRNRFILWRRYWRSAPAWVRRDIRGFLTESLGILLFERGRWAKLGMIVRGIADALRGVRGPWSPAHE
jgi:rhamnosyltransferase